MCPNNCEQLYEQILTSIAKVQDMRTAPRTVNYSHLCFSIVPVDSVVTVVDSTTKSRRVEWQPAHALSGVDEQRIIIQKSEQKREAHRI